MNSSLAREKWALALDNVTSREQIRDLVTATAPYVGVFKIGLEQFTRFGPGILDEIRSAQRKIFLDLKFHDIPNTVAKAVYSVCALGVDYLTIHTQGGTEMMIAAAQAARKSAEKSGLRPSLLGVTLLTSISPEALNSELRVAGGAADYVMHLASLAAKSGLDGIVCSAADLSVVKSGLPQNFKVITPGIRPSGSAANDQKRVATPKTALGLGATLLVVGRPVTAAADPGRAASEILAEIDSAST